MSVDFFVSLFASASVRLPATLLLFFLILPTSIFSSFYPDSFFKSLSFPFSLFHYILDSSLSLSPHFTCLSFPSFVRSLVRLPIALIVTRTCVTKYPAKPHLASASYFIPQHSPPFLAFITVPYRTVPSFLPYSSVCWFCARALFDSRQVSSSCIVFNFDAHLSLPLRTRFSFQTHASLSKTFRVSGSLCHCLLN